MPLATGNVLTAAATKATTITKTTKHVVIFVSLMIFVPAAVGPPRFL